MKRHVLTHRHTDLKEEFYARVRAQGTVPASETKIRADLAAMTSRVKVLRGEFETLNDTVERMARVINALTMENDRIRCELERRTGHSLVSIRKFDPAVNPPADGTFAPEANELLR